MWGYTLRGDTRRCTGDTKPEGGRNIDRAEVTQVMPERGGSESGGATGPAPGEEGGGEHGGSGGEGGAESREAAMSSPTIPLAQSWNGVLGGLAISASTTRQPNRSIQRCRTHSRRRSATYRPNLI